MGKRVKKTRNFGTLSEAGFRSFIISALRKQSLRWKPINECRKKNRVRRGVYRCEICGKLIKKGEVDHISPVVPVSGFTTWDDYINNMFCEIDGFQLLCSECHEIKTNKENEERKSKV